jgi:glycosyltransferase involved in cell wall biosynthesis
MELTMPVGQEPMISTIRPNAKELGHHDARKAILIVGNFLSSAGGNRGVCEDLANHLESNGWFVVRTSRRRFRPSRLVDMAVTPWRRRRAYSVAQVDVYSGPSFRWAESACWALRRAGKPYVLTLHGGSLPEFARRRPRRVMRLLRLADAVTAPSRYLAETMRPYRDDIRLLPNALDVAAAPFRHRDQPRPRLVWLRAFHEIYRPTLAVEVLARLKVRFPDVRLAMIGPDKEDGSLQRVKQLAAQLGVSDRLWLPGRISKSVVPSWLGEHDVFLNTTSVDNTPVSVQEAMACGLCLVSTDVGGLPYLLDHESDALLVPSGRADAMAAAVERILSEPALAARLSLNARKKAEGFDWSTVMPQWESLLQGFVRDGRAEQDSA